MLRIISYRQAINEALRLALAKDKNVVLFGEDIGIYGGAFGVTKNLLVEFGKKRIIDTPMSEAALTGVVTGAAMAGLKPILEIMFSDFLTLAFDQILNHLTKFNFLSDGQIKTPLVIRTPSGGGRGYGATHSQSLENFFLGVPGLKIIAPSNPYDAKGLLLAAIADDEPCLFIENKRLYDLRGHVPAEYYLLPLGKAKIAQEGKDLTLISYGKTLDWCFEATALLIKEGQTIEPEIIDLHCLKPLDLPTIFSSVKKTHRLIIVEEGYLSGGIGAEISSQVMENVFDYLDAPVQRVASRELPIACAPVLEKAILPQIQTVISAIRRIS